MCGSPGRSTLARFGRLNPNGVPTILGVRAAVVRRDCRAAWYRVQLARRFQVPVRFHGHVPPDALPSLYAAADVYALISTYEPFGVAVREAAAAGLPIVCSRSAGAAGDIAIEGRNALLVDPCDVEEVAGTLRRLASEPELRARMSTESRAIDRETEGTEVDAFVNAVAAAARRYTPSSPGSTSVRMRATDASGR